MTVRRTIVCAMLVLASTALAAAQPAPKDAGQCQDHPLFTRMPNYRISDCREKTFDSYAFAVGPKDKQHVEGHLWTIHYNQPSSATERPSQLQVLRNFEDAIKPLGGTVVTTSRRRETLKLTNGAKETWVEVEAMVSGSYTLVIVEKGGMAQDIVADAAALGKGLAATGHVTVDGILFDTGKATLKPESATAISEVATLLKNTAGLKLFVVGHTDTVGTIEANRKLSQERAETVVQELIRTHGIAAARLTSFGNGPFAPVASNDAEAGRARNRRVELVKQ